MATSLKKTKHYHILKFYVSNSKTDLKFYIKKGEGGYSKDKVIII